MPDPAGIPRASELRELIPRAVRGDREAFIRALKVGLYLHATQELGLETAQALELLGAVDWSRVTYTVTVEDSRKETPANG